MPARPRGENPGGVHTRRREGHSGSSIWTTDMQPFEKKMVTLYLNHISNQIPISQVFSVKKKKTIKAKENNHYFFTPEGRVPLLA